MITSPHSRLTAFYLYSVSSYDNAGRRCQHAGNGKDGVDGVAYERHRPEQTLLYQIVEAHYPALIDQLSLQGKSLPDHVHREFKAYLKCGRLEHGFLRVRCDNCSFERMVAFSCKKRGFLRELWRPQDGRDRRLAGR